MGPRRTPQMLFALAAIWAAFVLAPDLVLAWLDRDATTLRMWLVYATTMGASCVGWLAVGVGLAKLRARSTAAGLVGVVAFAVAISITVVATLGYRIYFDYDPKPVVVAFFLENFRYSLTLLRTSTSIAFRATLLGAPIVLTAALAVVTRSPLPALRFPRVAFGAGVAATVVLAVCAFFPARLSSAPPDIRGARVVSLGAILYLRRTELAMLPRPERVPVPVTAVPTLRPDVLLIVHESVGRRQVAPWTADSRHGAEFADFFHTHGEHALWFPRATTVAPVTNVAFPSLLSGLSPEAPLASFRTAPLLWMDAAARGYKTALFSSQDYKYSFFRPFFLGTDPPAVYATASELGGKETVDAGVDDAVTVGAAIALVESAPAATPLFVVIQFTGSHYPCWDPAGTGVIADTFDDVARNVRCERAIDYIDHQLRKLLSAFETAGRLEQTLIVSTSDHGETFDRTRPKRPISFYEDTLGVPLAIHAPRALVEQRPAAWDALRANRAVRVSNLDVYPTLLDLWGAWPLAADARRPGLAGESLLRPIAPTRVLASTSKSAIYDPALPGFALYHGDWKWVYEQRRGLRLFDLASDPDERTDRANDAPAEERAFFASELPKHPSLAAVIGVPTPSSPR